MKKIIFVLWLSLVAHTARSQQIEAHAAIADKGYNFWLFTPASITETPDTKRQAKPLIVFLHGSSLSGSNLNRVLNYGPLDAVRRGRKIDAYIVAPQSPGNGWNPRKVMDIVEWLEKHHNTIDKNRIYAVGMSMGGYGTTDFVGTYPHRIAAAMALCGGGTEKNVPGLSQVPLWLMHGTADRAVGFNNSAALFRAIEAKKGNRVLFSKLEGGNHGSPARAFYLKQTYEWLFKHKLNDPGRPVNRDYTCTMATLKAAYADIHQRDRSKIPIINNLTPAPTPDSKKKAKVAKSQASSETATDDYHTVQKGDVLSSIARRHHTTVQSICQLNGIQPTTTLQIGQRLKLK